MFKLEFKNKFKIGIFVFFALLILAVFIIRLGNVSLFFTKHGYEIFAYFDSIAGLEKNASVRMAGVKVGTVKRIRLKNGKAEVLMVIDPNVKIPKDSRATVSSLGLMGEKYIEIFSGLEKDFVSPGGVIHGIQPLSFDQIGAMFLSIGEELKSLSQQLQKILGDEETRTRISNLIRNLESATQELGQGDIMRTFKTANETFNKISVDFEEFSGKINRLTTTLQEMVEENRNKINKNLEKIENLIKEAEESLKLLNETLKKINQGEGTIGRLINEPQIFEKFDDTLNKAESPLNTLSKIKFRGGIGGYYLSTEKSIKNYIDLYLFYDKNTLFQTQVIKDPIDNKFKFSALAGWEINNFWLRGGIIESEFGLGFDYFFKEKFKISLDVYNFNRSSSPFVRLFAKYSLYPNVYIIVGLNDFTLTNNREILFGLGIGFK